MRLLTKDDESALRQYFDDIADSRPLAREQEVALAARIKLGDMEAREELVQANLRFVVDVAKNYQNRGLSLPELISAGNVGLMTAADRFDGTKGFKFISYAVWWIRQSILQTIADEARTVRLPLNKLSLLKDISKVTRKLGLEGEGEQKFEQIAEELEVAPEEVLDAILSARQPRSLDETFDDDERTLMNVLPDEGQEAPDEGLLDESAKSQVDRALMHLDDREQYIITNYFGLNGEDPLTLEQIGRLMGLTRERVRQLKERALGKLRSPDLYEPLLSLSEESEVF